MKLENLLNKPLPKMPDEIRDALEVNEITRTAFEDKNDILRDSSLQKEVGYIKMDDVTKMIR